MNKNLEEIRQKIDNLDDQIVDALVRRQKLVLELLPYKNPSQLVDSKREEAILARLKYKASLGNLNKKFIEIIYQLIFTNSVAEMKKELKKK